MNEEELYKKIDEDIGLKSKRKILTFTSLIFLAIQLSGAKIIEANTFILKLSFEHQNGIALLLVLAIIFSLLRYYNYAKPYHNILYSIWSKNLLSDGKISYHHVNDDVSGLLHEHYPIGFDIDSYLHQEANDKSTFDNAYECKFPFRRYFVFNWDDRYDQYQYSRKVNILSELGFKKYLKILKLEFKYQFSRYFTHRENLDILAPYFLGIIAICSYLFNDELRSILIRIL